MDDFHCSDCELTIPHDHGQMITPDGTRHEAIIYRVADPNAEVRDPETGEVIFPATKGPLKLIEGGLKTTEAGE